MTNAIVATRDIIASRIRTIAPSDHHSDPTTPAGIVLEALSELEAASDPSEAAGVFEQAGEASTEYTSDGCWDEIIDQAADDFLSDGF